jgi:hypothetical protein
MRPASTRSGCQGGFTLVEISIALVLLMLALLLASQLLMETSQLFAETSGESTDTPVPLVISRIRGDVQGSAGAYPLVAEDGTLVAVNLDGGPQGRIVYQKRGPDLFRTVVPANGDPPEAPTLLWPGVVGWSCQVVPGASGINLLDLSVTYLRHTTPHTPLAVLPAYRGPGTEALTQRLFLLPRGGGLGNTW